MSKIRCPICKNFYENLGLFSSCCPSCAETIDDDYKNVREYVKKNQGANITTVVEATGVDHKKVINYVKMEMLEITADSNTFLRCSICGVKIYTGMFCDDCKKRNGGDHKLMIAKMQSENDKMHISIFNDEQNPPLLRKKKKL